MALEFTESFDLYGTSTTAVAALQEYYDTSSLPSSPVVASGRTNNFLRLTTLGQNVTKILSTSRSTWIIGVAVRIAANSTQPLLQIVDNATLQVQVKWNGPGFIVVNGAGTTLGTASGTYTTGTWYYLELKVAIATSTGTWDLHIDGVSVSSGTGTTQQSANATADRFKLGILGGNQNTDFDDVYVCNTTGALNTSFLGPISVYALSPTGAGTTTQWTPLSGSNFANVNQTPDDGDTTYNSDGTTGDIDTYATADLTPTTGSIKGVNVRSVAKLDTAGSRTMAHVVRTGGSNFVGANISPTTAYKYWNTIWEQNPNTSANWTISDVNAVEIGAKVTA